MLRQVDISGSFARTPQWCRSRCVNSGRWAVVGAKNTRPSTRPLALQTTAREQDVAVQAHRGGGGVAAGINMSIRFLERKKD